MNHDEVDRLRRLVPRGIDDALANWARWTRAYRGGARGFRAGSSGFADVGLSSLDDLEHEVDTWRAEVADAIIDALPIHCRNAVAAVYAGGHWRLAHRELRPALLEATELFALRAKRKGLT